jgi:DNA primase
MHGRRLTDRRGQREVARPADLGLIARARQAKAAISLTTLVSETLPLRRQGSVWTALCPFHNEKTPSFCVFPDHHFHCFGCGAHGDAIDWLITTRRMTFAEAVGHLCDQSCNKLPYLVPPTPAPRNSHATVATFMRYWNEGVDTAGTAVETYLRTRGGLTVPPDAPIRFHPRCQRGSRYLPGGAEF